MILISVKNYQNPYRDGYSTGKKIDGWQWVWVPIAHVYYENEWKRKTFPVQKISRLRKTVFKL